MGIGGMQEHFFKMLKSFSNEDLMAIVRCFNIAR